jgi:UDP-glucuronate decarboxylase
MSVDDGRVVSNLIVQALRGQDMTVYGDGSQTRSFCFVSDLVSGLIKLMNSEHLHQPINLGNPGEVSVLQVAEKIRDLTGSSSGIDFRPLPPDDPVRRRPDITRAKEHLDWEPQVGLDEGLRRTADYFDGVLSGR